MSGMIDDKLAWVRMCTVRTALRLEIAGMRRSRRPSAYMVAKNVYGLKGNRQRVLDQLCEKIDKELPGSPDSSSIILHLCSSLRSSLVSDLMNFNLGNSPCR